MITRIYRVRIKAELRHEFEPRFQEIANEFVAGRDGLISVFIGKPTVWSPDEYTMITEWANVDSIIKFAGQQWGEPVIPDNMKQFTCECWLHQFESF